MTHHFFIFAGENSGDLHGSHLIKALKEMDSNCTISGVGGPLMRKEGMNCLVNMEEFQVMGFSDVLKNLPKLWRLFYKVRDAIFKIKPHGVILIDYPGFNLRLAKSLRKKEFKGKIIQYICPSIWAHGKKRIDTMVKNLDLLLTIFPFEPDYFEHTSLQVQYIGNPLVENIKNYSYIPRWKQQLNISEDRPLVAIFPGSRLGEIERNLPHQLEACLQLKSSYPETIFALSYAHQDLLEPIQTLLKQYDFIPNQEIHLIPKKFSYELMRDSHTAITKSGTVTVELALHQRPTVVVYQLTRLNYLIAKYLLRLKLPYYCMANILASKEVFPELIGKNISPEQIVFQLNKLYENLAVRENIKKDCKKIESSLGDFKTSQIAAEAIWKVVKC